MGSTTGSGRDHDVGERIAIHITGRHTNAAAETWVENKLLSHECTGEVEDPYVRSAALTGTDDNLRSAIAIDVAGRDVNSAVERRCKCHELEHQRAIGAIEDADVRSA